MAYQQFAHPCVQAPRVLWQAALVAREHRLRDGSPEHRVVDQAARAEPAKQPGGAATASERAPAAAVPSPRTSHLDRQLADERHVPEVRAGREGADSGVAPAHSAEEGVGTLQGNAAVPCWLSRHRTIGASRIEGSISCRCEARPGR